MWQAVKNAHVLVKLAAAFVAGLVTAGAVVFEVATDEFVTQAQFHPVRESVDSLQRQMESMGGAVTRNAASTDSLGVSIQALRAGVDTVRATQELVIWNQCLMLAELRGDSDMDRCRRNTGRGP